MNSEKIFEILATVFFAIALLHTFFASKLTKFSHRFKLGSVAENFLHLFGEVEIVFGFWSAILIILSIFLIDFNFTINYLNSRNFTEAMFVFVIMSLCSSLPIINFAEKVLIRISKMLLLDPKISIYFTLVCISPLLGSFITEPAAMTISAFLLLPRYFTNNHSLNFKYATVALLFLNISIGGTLTPYAAPPVLMVASKWGWDLNFMLTNFAPRTLVAVLFNSIIFILIFKKDILKGRIDTAKKGKIYVPFWVTLIHLIFLIAVVLTSHYPVLFIGVYLFFIGFLKATHEFQSDLVLKEPLLVGFFLAGLIVLGGPQRWWLEPIITSLNKFELYFGSIGLTAFTDNAALTYLGSLVPSLDSESKLALVKGSVVGGGLTLIANAPNPAGYGILRDSFGEEVFSPLKLVLWSLPITLITAVIFLL